MIINERPPNFELIRAAFPKAEGEGVIFAYDGNIYNPSGKTIPLPLLMHEQVHLSRQEVPDAWWHSYIHNSEFRAQRLSNDRNFGARLLMATALRLIAPLYNYTPPRSLQEALKDLQREIKS